MQNPWNWVIPSFVRHSAEGWRRTKAMTRRLWSPEALNKSASRCLTTLLGWGSLTAVLCSMSSLALGQEGKSAPRIYAWESVGVISDLSKNLMWVHCVLRLSGSSWSLLPGAVSKISELKKGDLILAEGRTDSGGSFGTRRIYRILQAATVEEDGKRPASDRQPDSSNSASLTRVSPAASREDGQTQGTRPQPTRKPASGDTPAAPLPDYSRFDAGDVIGTILELGSEQLVISRKFLVTKQTSILEPTGNTREKNSLQPGIRVAVTAADTVDRKTQTVKASVIRLLP